MGVHVPYNLSSRYVRQSSTFTPTLDTCAHRNKPSELEVCLRVNGTNYAVDTRFNISPAPMCMMGTLAWRTRQGR